MKGQRNALIKVLLAMLFVICSFGFIGCKPSGGDKESSTTYGEVGNYYCTISNEENELILEDGKYTLTIGDALITGNYSYDGAVLTLHAENEGGKNIIGSIDGTILTITYNGGTYSFYKKVDYTVTFDVDGGNAIAPVTVVNGQTVTKPADPTKEGYYFVGWYADKAYTKPFAFDADIITANTTIYARFVEQSAAGNEYTATLYVDGEVLESKTTVGGVLYALPTPQKGNEAFVGWWVSDYQSAEKLTYKYENQALTQNVNLYAVWESDGMQISVDSKGASWSAIRTGVEYTVTIKCGDDVVLAPKKTTALSVDYDFASSEAGEYTVTVEAEGKTAVAYYKNKALARVSIFSVTDSSVFVFVGVENAEKYLLTIKCGNADHQHENYDNGNSTNYNFANCTMKEGGIEFVVTAVANGYISSVSDTPFVYNPMLDAVSGIVFDNDTGLLTWDAVENATDYDVTVTVDGVTEKYNLKENAFSLTKYTGEVAVTIRALNVAYNSPAATEFTCNINKLPAPVVQYVEDKVVWTAVEGAKSYVVKVDGDEYPVNGTEFVIPAEYNVAGRTCFISVKAVAEDTEKNSYYSEEITVSYGEICSLEYSANNLRWGAVAGASSYIVKVGTLQVAKGDSSLRSAEITFKVAGKNIITLFVYDSANKMITYKSLEVEAYEIKLDVQGGSVVKTVYAAAGDKISVEETKKQYYIFAGWYSAPNGPEGNGMLFDTEKDTVTGATTLYAYWTPMPYELELKVGKTVYNETTQQYEYVYDTYTEIVYYQCEYTLLIPEIEDKSKVFYGWYGDDNIESTPYTDPNGKSVAKWTKTTGYTLYAGWVDALAYTLHEGVNGPSWHITQGAATKLAKEITVPAAHTDPITKKTYPVTAIDTNAFAYCDKLEVLNLPDTLETIFLAFGSTTSGASTASALYQCTRLKAINVYCVDEDGVHDEDSTHRTYYSSVNGLLLRHASPNTETLDYGVELVFVPYAGRGTLVVPEGVSHIPTRVFYALNYTKIILPASVTRIGDRAFYRAGFSEIVFEEAPEGVDEKPLTLTEGVLNDLNRLVEISIPARIGNLDLNESNMFSNDNNLRKINVVGRPTPEQLKNKTYYTSNNGVVCNYDGTELVYVPKHIDGTYTIPTEIEVIGSNAFVDCWSLEGVVIKDNVKRIKSDAFLRCISLSSVTFEYERGSLEIDSRAFYECTNLYSIEFPSQLKYLGSHAFGNTPKLTEVTINGASNAVLEWGAFAEETGRNNGYVTTVNLGAGAPWFEINSVFYGCNLYALNIDETNPNYDVDGGVLYNKGKTTILYYPFGLTENYTIPDTVTTIGQGVFENRANITSIEIPASVTTIEFYAFKNCVGLQSLTFAPRTADLYIAPSAFENCIALTSVSLPEGMKEISSWAFANCTNLTTVHIPSTVTNFVLSEAFYGCKKIKTVTVAENSKSYGIEGGILYEKDGDDFVSVLFVPDGLGDVVIPSSVSNIGEGVFNGKSGITSVSFENNTASNGLTLGQSVFANMTSLREVRLPEGLEVIPAYAFMGSNVTSVYVPKSVIEVMPGAFANCKKLTTVTFEDGSEELAFKDASSKTGAFFNTPNLTSITLPNRMTAFAKYMFAGSSISEITLPNNLEVIGEGAFVNCKNLTTFVMPNTVKVVEMLAFSGCTSLESVTLSSELTELPDYLFASALKDIVGPTANNNNNGGAGGGDGGIPIIPPKSANRTPQYKGGINEIDDTVVGLVEDVEACTALKTIVIPAKVTAIGQFAFTDCTALKTVTFESNTTLTKLGAYAFVNTGITAFDMPDSVTYIGVYQFAGCKDLATLTISPNVTAIPNNMCDNKYEYEYSYLVETRNLRVELQDCAALKEIVIPVGVTSIGASAFKNTTGLASVTFENGTAIENVGVSAFENSGIKTFDISTAVDDRITLGDFAFRGSALENVNLPFSVKSLGSAFVGCNNIKKFEIEDDGDSYTENDFFNVDAEALVVYNGDRDEIRLYLGSAEEFIIPDGVTKIHYNAFRSNTSLKSVTIPKSVRYIEDGAFAFCSNLATITIPEDSELLEIGYRAFAFSGITSIMLPESVQKIGTHTYNLGAPSEEEVAVYEAKYEAVGVGVEGATNNITIGWELASNSKNTWHGRIFEGCTFLTLANLRTTVSCEKMFDYCVSLSRVMFSGNTRTLQEFMFHNCISLKDVTLPWLLTHAGRGAFYGTGIEEIHIPSTLNVDTGLDDQPSWGVDMFAYCKSLKKVTFDDNVRWIADNMFRESAVEEVVLPKNIQVIGEMAFAFCKNLKKVTFPEKYVSSLTILDGAFGDSALEGDLDFSNVDLVLTYLDVRNELYTAREIFRGTNITSIKFPDSVTELGALTFFGCEKLQTVEMKNLKVIGFSCFAYTTALESITLAEDATEIGSYAFEGATSLKEITIPDSVTTLGERAFMNSGLEKVTLGTGITYIPDFAFSGSKLKSINIPKTVTLMEPNAFIGCKELSAFSVDMGNKDYKAGDFGELYNANNQLMFFPAASTGDNGSFVMPTSTTLSPFAFYGSCLNSVEVSSATTFIPTATFKDSAVSTVKLTSNVTRIGAFAFMNCVNLVEIQLPDSISDPSEEIEVEYWITNMLEMDYDENAGIGESAFEGCTSLKTVNIPKFMFKLAARTFKGCISLKEIIIPEGMEVIESEAFAETGLVEVVLPETIVMLGTFNEVGGKEEKSRKGEAASHFGLVFANCTSLKKVVFESVVMDVFPEAFIGCTALEEVVLANGWEMISDGMFIGCTSLNIEIPETVETVGIDAFAGWTANQTITIHISLEKANNLWGEGWNGEATVIVK